MAMDKKIKKDWIAALRSGDYGQGVGKLHDAENNTFCALGVLCDLWRREERPGTTWADFPRQPDIFPHAMRWAGLCHEAQATVIGWSDGWNSESEQSATFGEIADDLERYEDI